MSHSTTSGRGRCWRPAGHPHEGLARAGGCGAGWPGGRARRPCRWRRRAPRRPPGHAEADLAHERVHSRAARASVSSAKSVVASRSPAAASVCRAPCASSSSGAGSSSGTRCFLLAGTAAGPRRRRPPARAQPDPAAPVVPGLRLALCAALAASRRMSATREVLGCPPRKPDCGSPSAGARSSGAAEHVPEDPLERLDVVLAGHQGGQRAQVEAGQRRWTGHGDGPGEPLTPARIGGYSAARRATPNVAATRARSPGCSATRSSVLTGTRSPDHQASDARSRRRPGPSTRKLGRRAGPRST